jgi:hypothetical protein
MLYRPLALPDFEDYSYYKAEYEKRQKSKHPRIRDYGVGGNQLYLIIEEQEDCEETERIGCGYTCNVYWPTWKE